jgi:hypothetical protein
MFLDDKLYNHVKSRKLDSAEDMQTCINELYKICEDHYKPILAKYVGEDIKIVRIEMDRVFNAWNAFVKRLDKEDFMFAAIFTIPGISYKERFLSHPKLKAIYERGK